MPTAAPSTRTTTSPPPPSTSRGWLRRCAVTGGWRACTGCWTWRSGMTCRATAAGTGPKTRATWAPLCSGWGARGQKLGHRAPLCARAGAGQSGQGQREDAAQDGQLEPGVPPPGPSAPSPHLIAVHPDSAPCLRTEIGRLDKALGLAKAYTPSLAYRDRNPDSPAVVL